MDRTKRDKATAELTSRKEEGGVVLSLSGRLSLDDLTGLTRQVDGLLAGSGPIKLTADLREVAYVDSGGALFLLYLERTAQERSIPFAFLNMSPQVQSVLKLLDPGAIAASRQPVSGRGSSGLFEEVGMRSVAFLDDIVRSLTFGGTLVWEVASSIFHPSSLRWKDVAAYVRRVGVDGLPILALISYLLGLIIAFMSSLQLKQFGANMYVASLVAIAMVRELGPIITAIVVAGRSGSAFAAEIGTMKVNEEVDALVTMGFNPFRFLAVPKVLAAIIVVPLLTFFSDLFAILGGMTVALAGLGLTFRTYVQQTSWALEVFDIGAGVVEIHGLCNPHSRHRLPEGLSDKGRRGGSRQRDHVRRSFRFFLIIVADSTFAIILNYIRW